MTALPIEQTPPCTCDVGQNEPHAEDCPRAKRLHADAVEPGGYWYLGRDAEWYYKDSE